jgi:hypothetical protein
MERACAMLDQGADGEAVMSMLRAKCPTVGALSNCISRIRAAQLADASVPRHVVETMAPYAEDEAGVHAFLSLPLVQMTRVQREHTYDPTWSAGAEAALASLRLLPDNLRALKLSPSELVSLKRTRDGALVRKQESLLHVHHAGEWLQYAVALANESAVEMSFARLSLPLLLLTGRRTTEILNGKSTFAPTPRPTTCLFTGAIKKRGAASPPFEIPLLCEYEVLARALHVLRAKQGGEQLEPAACNNRYHRRLNGVGLFPFVSHVHQLRAVYAAFAYRLYACDVTFNRAAMQMLGHEKLEVSLSYNAVVLHGLAGPDGRYGQLP